MSVKDIIRSMFDDTKPEGTQTEIASASVGKVFEGHKNQNNQSLLEVQRWLPLAAEKYEISKSIKDYVIAPVIIFPTDIPNRNSVAFPMETLMQFNVSQGRPNYKTWVGKPTFTEHAHHDYTKAKGIIFDTYLRPLEHAEGNLYKLVALCGFDRTKDYELANAILTGRRKSYSMGAFVAQYECSVCGMKSKPGKMNTECGHVVRGQPQIFEVAGYHIPSYLIARKEITGFEISSVGVPAWSSATSSKVFDMNSY